MCGIAGIILFDNKKIQHKTITSIKNSLYHRGPDSSGHWLSEDHSKLLINTRLSILDLSTDGNQPFYFSNKRFVVVFNGEIYNYQELKKKLSEYKFKSNTDTEVLLYMYHKYGAKFLDDLDGIFSIAIYDNKKKQLFCARDRYGVKPFYYIENNNNFYFASEIKTLKMLNIIKNNVNLRAVSSYLTSEYYENTKYTFFKNIQKLKPGYYIKFNQDSFEEKKFTSFNKDFKKIYLPSKVNDRQEMLYCLINEVVKKSMTSDVRCSIATSGGLDSSILQLLVKNNSKYNITGISFGFTEKKYSEEKFVKEIAKISKLKIKYHILNSNFFFNTLEKNIIINEEPFAGLPVMAYQECINKINTHKVILDGSGIDEMHFGYEKYLNKKYNIFNTAQDGTKSALESLLLMKFKKNNKNYDFNPIELFEENYKNHMYYDLFYIKLPRALRFRDKISMANSAELRPSFLDKNLINFFFNLDINDHYYKGSQKYLLKKTFSEIYNSNFFYKNKRQVQTPMREWFKKELFNQIDNLIHKSLLWSYDIYNKKLFQKKAEEFFSGKINNAFFLWQFINLDLWFKNNKF
jgi:asparagine synthase (glutamine-hydrolysing)